MSLHFLADVSVTKLPFLADKTTIALHFLALNVSDLYWTRKVDTEKIVLDSKSRYEKATKGTKVSTFCKLNIRLIKLINFV